MSDQEFTHKLMKRFKIRNQDGAPLVQLLAEELEISKKKAKGLIDARAVFVNGKRHWMAQTELFQGDEVEVHIPEEVSSVTISLDDVLYQDEQYIIFNKPPNILTNGADSLESQLKDLISSEVCAVHRLDRDTSGCNIFAHSGKFKDQLELLFRQKKVEKIYHALVENKLDKHKDEIRIPIDGKAALTEYTVVSSNDRASHLRLSIGTGRMHQIRKHMLAIGHPVLGDKEYQRDTINNAQFRSIQRQLLHARSIQFENPVSQVTIKVQAKLPEDFLACLKMLNLS